MIEESDVPSLSFVSSVSGIVAVFLECLDFLGGMAGSSGNLTAGQ